MAIQVGQLNGNILTLPPKIARKLAGVTQLLIIEQKDGLWLKTIAPPKRKRLEELASNLDRLDEIAPLTQEEIDAEVHLSRAEKRVAPCA